MKAILEIEMPNSCWGCKLCACDTENGTLCVVTGKSAVLCDNIRLEDCPLKPIEG